MMVEVLGTISKANEYLDKNSESRKKAIEKGQHDLARKRIEGAHKAIDRLNANIDRERARMK